MTRRRLRRSALFALLGGIALVGLFALVPSRADTHDSGIATVFSTRLETFDGARIGERVGGLVFAGGLTLQSAHPDFGGLSGLALVSETPDAVFVSDRGRFVSGRLAYDDAGVLSGFERVRIAPLLDTAGDPLERATARDAESVETVWRDGVPAAVRVGFERQTRIADFALENGRPGGPARTVPISQWLEAERHNQGIESVCIAPPSSPVAGSTLILTEDVRDGSGDVRGTLLGRRDRGDLSYRTPGATVPTDCAFLPDGDLLVLERDFSVFTFSMALRLVPADRVRPGAVLEGEVLLEAAGSAIDNMEGLAVREGPDGSTRLLIVSDDNFSPLQRTLLLEFVVP